MIDWTDEQMKQFLMGFAYRPTKEKEMTMIEEFIMWKSKQDPFTDDRKFFAEKYGTDLHPFNVDLFLELYSLREQINDMCEDIKNDE